jgi:hypothetical protein
LENLVSPILIKVGDSSYTVADFLEAVQRHDKMQTHTKQKTPLALLGNPHDTKAKKVKLRICATAGCKKHTPSARFSFCNSCYRERQKNSAVLDAVPATVRDKNEQKRKEKLEQKYAQLKRKASDMTIEALLSEFEKIVTEADEGDVSSTEKKNKKRRKKGKKPKAEANIADAAEANVLDTTSKCDVVSKKRSKAEPFFKHTAALKITGKSKKSKRRKQSVDAKPTEACTDATQAFLVMPDPLAGCVVHNFAGGAKLPSQFLHM